MKKILSAILACVLVLGCVFALASCGGPNKDPEAAKKALEDAGYTVRLATEGLGADLEAYLSASKVDGENYERITIAYCANSSVASEQYDAAKESLEAAGDEAEGYTAGRSGKVVWMGTDAAIKAANGKAKPADSNDDGSTDSDDIDNDGWTGGGDENPTYVPCNKSSDAQKALKKAGYETSLLGDDSLKYAEGISEILHGSKNDDFINIYYFESTEYAEQYYKILLEEFLSSGAASNATIGKSGKMIWAGTLTAIKAASGSSGKSEIDPDGWSKP